MKPAVELNELMERIRHAAHRENGLPGGSPVEISAASDLPPVPEPLPPPPSPLRAGGDPPETVRPESLLDQAASLLQGGRKKNAVAGSVPKLLRPLFRNQGGVNGVVLEAVERLLEVNRILRHQNYQLQEQLLETHAWMHSVTQASAENRDWTLVADARLRDFTDGRMAQLEARLARLEKKNGAAESREPASPEPSVDRQPLDRLRAQAREQAEYLRSVHGHLDKLGAHVEAGFARLDGQAAGLAASVGRLEDRLRNLQTPTDAA